MQKREKKFWMWFLLDWKSGELEQTWRGSIIRLHSFRWFQSPTLAVLLLDVQHHLLLNSFMYSKKFCWKEVVKRDILQLTQHVCLLYSAEPARECCHWMPKMLLENSEGYTNILQSRHLAHWEHSRAIRGNTINFLSSTINACCNIHIFSLLGSCRQWIIHWNNSSAFLDLMPDLLELMIQFLARLIPMDDPFPARWRGRKDEIK